MQQKKLIKVDNEQSFLEISDLKKSPTHIPVQIVIHLTSMSTSVIAIPKSCYFRIQYVLKFWAILEF